VFAATFQARPGARGRDYSRLFRPFRLDHIEAGRGTAPNVDARARRRGLGRARAEIPRRAAAAHRLGSGVAADASSDRSACRSSPMAANLGTATGAQGALSVRRAGFARSSSRLRLVGRRLIA